MLLAPVRRITGYDIHFPYFQCEKFYLPDSDTIVKGVMETMGWGWGGSDQERCSLRGQMGERFRPIKNFSQVGLDSRDDPASLASGLDAPVPHGGF